MTSVTRESQPPGEMNTIPKDGNSTGGEGEEEGTPCRRNDVGQYTVVREFGEKSVSS